MAAAAGGSVLLSDMMAAAGESAIVAASFTCRRWVMNEDILSLTHGNDEIYQLIESKYRQINVKKTMTELLQNATLLRTAMTAARNDEASKSILFVMTSFQTMVGNSELATSAFTVACLKSLKLHGMALKAMEKQKSDLALKMFSQCAAQATAMERIAQKLVDETKTLWDAAEKAILANATDAIATQKALEANEKEQAEITAQRNYNQEILNGVGPAMAREKDAVKAAKEQESSDQWKTLGKKAAVVGILAAACPPAGLAAGIASCFMSGGGEAQAQKAREAEAEIRRLLQQELQANADMAKNLALLRQAEGDHAHHESVSQCLILCKQALGRILNRFEALRLFWGHIALHCQTLADTDAIEFAVALEDDDEFRSAFVASGKSWAALGLISLQANEALVSARLAVADVMENLPRGDERASVVQEMCQALEQQIEDNIETATQDAENSIKMVTDVTSTERTVTEIMVAVQ